MEENKETEEIVESLVNPDVAKKPKYSWDDNFQRRIVGLILTDTYFLVQARSLVLPEYFSNECHSEIIKICLDYFEKYKVKVEMFVIEQALADKVKSRDEAVRNYYKNELENIQEFFVPEISSREVLLDKITFFAKIQALKVAI